MQRNMVLSADIRRELLGTFDSAVLEDVVSHLDGWIDTLPTSSVMCDLLTELRASARNMGEIVQAFEGAAAIRQALNADLN